MNGKRFKVFFVAILMCAYRDSLVSSALSSDLHSAVPSACPSSNRTRIISKGPGNAIIGEINQSLLSSLYNDEESYRELFVNTGGVYLLPEPAPFNGKIVSMKAFGFIDVSINITTSLDPFIPMPSESGVLVTNESSISAPYLYVLVYRPTRNGSVYNLVQNLTQLDHGFTPGRLPANQSESLDWEVQMGDLIGAYIPRHCVKRSDGIPMCPSQINLKTEDCLSAFYHPALNDVDNLSSTDFQEVSLQLNLEVTLSATVTAPGGLSHTALAVIITGLLIVMITITAIGILIAECRMRRLKASAPAEHGDNCSTYATIVEKQAVVVSSNQTNSTADAEEEEGVYEVIAEDVNNNIDEAKRSSLEYEVIEEEGAGEMGGNGEECDHDNDTDAVESEDEINVIKNDAYHATTSVQTFNAAEEIVAIMNEAYASKVAEMIVIVYENSQTKKIVSPVTLAKEMPPYVNIHGTKITRTKDH